LNIEKSQIVACPICQHPSADVFRTTHVSVAKCQSNACGHLFVPDAAQGDGIQTHINPEADWDMFVDRNRRLVDVLLRKGMLWNGCRVLDFGSGSGHVARSIHAILSSVKITCVEADRKASEFLREKGFDVHECLSSVRGTYDFVSLIEVIEHIQDPISILNECRKLLDIKGHLFFSTPCGELQNGSRRTNAYDTKEHIHFFTEKSLRNALGKAGFGPIKLETLNQLYPQRQGLGRSIDVAKDILRPLRARLFGHHHLVGFAELRR